MDTQIVDVKLGSLQAETAPPRRCHTILLVDDADNTRLLTKWFLSNFGYIIHAVRTGEEALRVFDPGLHDLVVTDNSMPGMSGIEMAHVLKLRSDKTPVVMYSGNLPQTAPCIDVMIQRPTHLLSLKLAIEQLLASPAAAAK